MRANKIPEALTLFYNAGITLELRSSPGAGKSSIVEQWAAHMSIKLKKPFGLIAFMLATISPYDFGGFMYPAPDPEDETGKGQRLSAFSRPPVMPHPAQFKSMRGGSYMVFVDGVKVESFDGVPEAGIVFLDEYGQADIDMKKMSADLMLNRRIRGAALPGGWGIVAASNRQEDRSGVTKDLAFVNNRIGRINMTNDIEDFKKHGMANGIHYVVSAWASFAPTKVFSDKPPEAGVQFCTPRSLMMTSKILHQMEQDAKIDWESDFLRENVCGLVGDGAGTELIAFGRMASQLTSWEEIMKDPEKARMPDNSKVDALHAVCDMVATRVDKTTAIKAFTYILRAPREFQVATFVNVTQRVPTLLSHPEFSKWLSKNKGLLISANSP